LVGRQAWQIGGLKNIAVDSAVAEPDRVRLSKGMVKPDVVLVLVLGIRILIERIAVEAASKAPAAGSTV